VVGGGGGGGGSEPFRGTTLTQLDQLGSDAAPAAITELCIALTG